MKEVLYSSPYIPPEWIAAHGLQPVCLGPQKVTLCPPVLERQGVCPFVRSFASQVLNWPDASAIVMTTTCDQMRRAYDIMCNIARIPSFLLNIPATYGASSKDLYLSELKRLGRFLTHHGGTTPSDTHLSQVMLDYENSRATKTDSIDKQVTIPIALVGGPYSKNDQALFNIVEQFDARIVLDATETGQSGRPLSFDIDKVRSKPLIELADAYFTGIQDIRRRPNDSYYRWLEEQISRLNIQAIIMYRYLWCDLLHVELQRLRERTGLPVLDLDIDDADSFDSNRNRTRIGAFMEMLV